MTISAGAISLLKKFSTAATIAYQQSVGGLDLIKGFEGLRLNAYLDTAGVPTIGWGSTYYADGRKVKMGDKLKSRAEADRLLLVTLNHYCYKVNEYVRVKLTQNQFDALVSLVYNIGVNGFAESTLLEYLNAGSYIKAADQFLVWNKARNKAGIKVVNDGLVTRRVKERALFLKP